MVKHEYGKRLPPSKFDIPVEKIKKGWYSDKYFTRTREVLKKDNNKNIVLMQIFCRKDAIVCGLDETIALLKLCSTRPEKLKIEALYDGDSVKSGETVMTIEGEYSTFAHLETIYLGIIGRSTAVATAVRQVVEAADGRKVLFFSARFDHYTSQISDGYSALIGGAHSVSTDAQGSRLGEKGLGTIPHGLIAAYEGDTVKASSAFHKHIDPKVDRIVLVDFNNDCVNTALSVARVMGKHLWGIRLDTARDLVDKSVVGKNNEPYGVCPELVFKTRESLDKEGFNHVKIIISGGFDAEKIKRFSGLKVPFDAVGVGSSLLRERIDFTADIVKVNGKLCSKVGRKYNPNPRLKPA